jgi:DTW domain-containing protein YfiP
MSDGPREVCARCRRPAAFCYCAHLVPLQARTRVVFLQHPREAKVPIGTARMAHLLLVNSELHRGVHFAEHPRVRELAADPTAALLFPGEGATDPAALSAGAVRTLLVVDGTWAQARKVLRENPVLGRLRRIGLVPAVPGNYRIRREPAKECLATVEAVSQVLGLLEGEAERFAGMLAAFTFMVDRQIEMAASQKGPRRRRGERAAQVRANAGLAERLSRAVVVHAEVNAHARRSAVPGRAELLHLVARRLGTGEEFCAVVVPRRPLSPSAAFHLGLDPAALLGGEPIAAALSRWQAFLRPQDVLCGWGSFVRDQLAAEGAEPGDWLDLRPVVARRLQGSPGTPRHAAERLVARDAAPTAPEHDPGGRAGRTVVLLGRIVAAFSARPGGPPP